MSQTLGVGTCCAQPGNAQAELFSALSNFLREVAACGGSQSQQCGPRPQPEQSCGGTGSSGGSQESCGCGEDETTVSGEFSIWGDPHVDGDVEVNGESRNFNLTTEGGNGKVINLFDTDNLDIEGKFDTLNRQDGNTYVTEETVTAGNATIAIDADDNKVTLNGREIEDGTYNCQGNTITKQGDTVTIETADGQKIKIVDRGEHLDTYATLNDFQSGEMGGMVGDAINGNANDNAEDYVAQEEDCGCQQQDSNWAVDLLRGLGGMISGSNPALGGFLSALASFISQSQTNGSVSGAAAA